MHFDVPSSDWLPLSKGLFHFHSGLDKEATPEQILNSMLRDLCEGAPEVHAELEDGMIFISRVHRNVGRMRLETIGTYTVEDGLKYDSWLLTTPPEEFQKVVSAVIMGFIERAERSLRWQHAGGRCQIFARVETPLQRAFTKIPPDVFAHFAVSDWRRGVAVSASGEKIYSIHAGPAHAPTSEVEPSDPTDTSVKTASRKHRYEEFAYWARTEGVSRQTGSLEVIRREYAKSPVGRKLDDKTLRKAFDLIDRMQGY